MTRTIRAAAFALAAATATATATIGLAGAAQAHHSFAMFDPAKVVTLQGRVKEYRWVNPHVALLLDVAAPGNGGGVWAVELTSPGNLTRLGWSRKSLKPGDRVAVEINPLRDGQHGGGFRKLTLLDTGQVLQARLIDIEKNAAAGH
ncbi:DUF6152 family protein [Novosphingobium olei]|uniref:DUF5666 domain-containing protein n=1 Tax=Novosphingobium olei TaxID=2728851 RepID=A0A7Y0BL48_9SPHN|nr:DUF6152 family protein [Novosphingobium olei]NML92230.1 hypothetical protein [Novosphingobium olei]